MGLLHSYTLGGAVHGYVQPSIYRQNIQGYDIETYGEYNTYPQEVDYALSRSSIADACTQTLAEFVYGDGFENEDTGDSIVNDSNETFDEVLWQICQDFAKYKGFALLLNANILGEYTSIQSFPFSYVRMGLPNEEGRYTHARIWDNWAGESPRTEANLGEIYSIPLFNPASLKDDIEEAGGIENFGGQLVYFGGSAAYNPYPKAPCDSAMEQVLMSGNLAYFLSNYTKNGFSASAIIVNPELSSEEQRLINARQIKDMGGAREAGSIQYFEGAPLELLDLSNTKNLDKDLVAVQESNDQSITRAYQVPNILLGSARQGGFPNQDEMKEGTRYYNSKTRMYRRAIAKKLERVAAHFVYPIGSDFSIKETSYEGEAALSTNDSAKVVEPNESTQELKKRKDSRDNVSSDPTEREAQSKLRGSVGGVQGILALLDAMRKGNIEKDSVAVILEEIYGFGEETTREIIGDE